MTYNVFGGTLKLAQSNLIAINCAVEIVNCDESHFMSG